MIPEAASTATIHRPTPPLMAPIALVAMGVHLLAGLQNGNASGKMPSFAQKTIHKGLTMTAHRSLQDALIAEYAQLDPGPGAALAVDRQEAYFSLNVGSTAEARTVPIPNLQTADALGVNIVATIGVDAVNGGSVAITCPDGSGGSNPVNAAGNTTITLSAAGAFVILRTHLVGGKLQWRIESSDGAALS